MASALRYWEVRHDTATCVVGPCSAEDVFELVVSWGFTSDTASAWGCRSSFTLQDWAEMTRPFIFGPTMVTG